METLSSKKFNLNANRSSCVNYKICEIYKFIKKNINTGEITRSRNIILEKYKFTNPRFDQILQASDNLFKEYSVSIIPICSLVDDGFVEEWSDVDCMLYLEESCFEPSKLRKIQAEVIKLKSSFSFIDPMQDHGLFSITDIDLMSYSENRMPISVLSLGYAYPHKIEFSFRCDTSNEEIRQKELIHFLKNEILILENLKYNYANFRYLLHRVFLFPSLYYQYHGLTLYKPIAIAKYIEESRYNLGYFQCACEFYNNFHLKRNYRSYISINILRKFTFIAPFFLRFFYSIKNKNIFDNEKFNKIRFNFIRNLEESLIK